MKRLRVTMRTGGSILLGAAVLTALLQFALHATLGMHISTIHLADVGTALDKFHVTTSSSNGDGSSRISPKEERCAINLFGLPRAFKSLVLPSLIQNVLIPNAAHNCDYFVHYFNLTEEAAGRSGKGGQLDPSEILSLEQHVHRQAVKAKHQRPPTVMFHADQEADFWTQHHDLIEKTRTIKDNNGNYLYFPWKAKTYTHPTTVDNILKMWHSIHAAWNLMDQYADNNQVKYIRVAMLRSDVVYVTPIDLYQLDSNIITGSGTRQQYDAAATAVVVPAFGKHPVSDRIIYGPYAAVKIWAAERFDRMEAHVQSMLKNYPGWGMHSERFLNNTIFPAMKKAGFTIHEHSELCFFRARVDESVWISDCDGTPAVAAPTIAKRIGTDKKGLVERLIGRTCGKISKFTHSVRSLDCASSTYF